MIVLAAGAAAIAGVAGCAGGGNSSDKQNRPKPTTLPPGGTRAILHGKETGSTIKAVVYGGSGEVKKIRGSNATPKPGNHFVGVKLGLRNMGTKTYISTPSLTASVTSNNGDSSTALESGKRGFGEVKLKPSEFVLGRLFFEVPDDTKLSAFSFKPFGPTSKVANFTMTHGKSAENTKSTKPLPEGGTRKILRGTQPGRVVTAVVYGSSGQVDDSAVAAKPHAGNHFVAIKVGLKNLGKRLYSVDPAVTASIENNNGDLFKAVPGAGLGQVELQRLETAYGRIFFELADDTKVSSFRFRPFGTKGKLAVLPISHGTTVVTASAKPLPDGGTRKILEHGGTTLKAVVYGSSGGGEEVKPREGYHFIAVKLGLRNMKGGLYRGNPSFAAFVTNDKGQEFRAVRGKLGVGKVELKENQGVYGGIFFEIPDKTRPHVFRFRPFGVADRPVAFAIKHGGGQPVGKKLETEAKSGTKEPLPSGGTSKVIEHGDTTVKAVVYGGQGDVSDSQFAVKPPEGYHIFALGLGLRNMEPGTYRGTPFLVTSITNNNGEVAKAMRSRYGLGKVLLEPDRGVYGRLFFQMEDHTRPASVQIRVFGYGPKTKTTVFTIEHGK